MEEIKGRLFFMGWHNLPWRIKTNSGDIDLWPIVDRFLKSLIGKRAKQEQEFDSYTLKADETSELQLYYVPGQYILLEKPEGIGMLNVYAYLGDTLVWFSGRKVKINIEYEERMELVVDKSEKVFGVYFSGDGNSCRVPEGAEEAICKVGQENCCIFLSAGPEGFQCEKFSGSFAHHLLNRLAKGEINATRIGNCALLGREK